MPERSEERVHDGTAGHKYVGMSSLFEAVDELSSIPGLENECANLRRTTFFRGGKDSGTATGGDWNTLHGLVGELKNIAQRIRLVLGAMVEDSSPNTIAVRLPPTKGLGELKEVIGDLQLALERPVQLVLKEHIRLEGVDRGSIWLMLIGSTVAVVKFTFGILLASNHYMRKQAELDRYLEGTKAISSLNDYVRTVEDANAKMMSGLSEALTKQLLEGREVDGEAVNTTLNAIKTLAELRKQGLEMQLAANAPKEVKDVYEQFFLRDLGVGELMPKLPPQLTAGAGAPEQAPLEAGEADVDKSD